LRLSYKVLLIN